MDSANVFEVLQQEPHNLRFHLYHNTVPPGETTLASFQEVSWPGYVAASADRWGTIAFGSEFVSRSSFLQWEQELDAAQPSAVGWYATIDIAGVPTLVAWSPFAEPIALGAPRSIGLRVRLSAFAPSPEGHVAMEVDGFGFSWAGEGYRRTKFRGDERRLLLYALSALERISTRDAALSMRVLDSRLSLVPVFPGDHPVLVAAVERVRTRLRDLLSL